MKIRFKIIIGLLAACATALLCGACSSDNSPYGEFDKDGFSVSVRYDSNGGNFAGTSAGNINLVDVIPLSAFENGGVKLVEPGSEGRGNGQLRSKISRTGYFLIGWYRERTPRVSENGEPLDAYGNVITYTQDAEGNVKASAEQGYIYSGLWNFDEDLLEIEGGEKYTSKEVVLTLYAAWAPNFSYVFYEQEEESSSWAQISSYSFNPLTQSNELDLPFWEDGAMNYGSFPQNSGKTFQAVYTDEALQSECTQTIAHTGRIDYEKGIAVDPVNKFYTEWKDGVWFRIQTTEQFIKNARADGCYEISADLDFTGATWPEGFARGNFTGTILGNGHTLSGITATQTDLSQLYGGLFGQISERATIRDITFENVVYQLLSASRYQGAFFGLFTGSLSEKATIENVTVSGELQIGNVYGLFAPGEKEDDYDNYYDGYSVGLLSGNLVVKGIDYRIDCKAIAVQSGTTTSYPRIARAQSDGSVRIYANEDPSKDPNEENN